MRLHAILCGIYHLSGVIQSAAVEQDTGVVSARVGDNVTLRCFYDSQVAMHFSWYRQALGSRPELLSSVYKHEKLATVSKWLVENTRFSVQREEGANHLHISDVHLSDSATYFCGSSHSNTVEFGEGVFLSVRGSPSHSCVCHLQRMNLSSPDAGTHHCAVASGGEVLFGSGGEVLVTDDTEAHRVAQMRILVWLSIGRAAILVLFLTGCLSVYCTKSRQNPQS